MRTIAAFLLALFLPLAASAYTMDEWLRHYQNPPTHEEAAAFFFGVMRGAEIAEADYGQHRLYCQTGVTMGELEKQFIIYADETRRGWEGSGIWASSIMYAFHKDKLNCK